MYVSIILLFPAPYGAAIAIFLIDLLLSNAQLKVIKYDSTFSASSVGARE